MRGELKAESDIRGQRIDLTFTWAAPERQPRLRLVRRRRAYPRHAEDGLCVLDLGESFQGAGRPWPRRQRRLYLVDNSLAEGGLRQAEFALFYDQAGRPVRAQVTWYDTGKRTVVAQSITAVTRVEWTQTPEDSSGASVERASIFAAPEAGAEVLAGQVVVSTGNQDGQPGQFSWIVADKVIGRATFDSAHVEDTAAVRVESSADALRGDFLTTLDGIPTRQITCEERYDPDGGVWQGVVTVADLGLEAGAVYYYAGFLSAAQDDPWLGDVTWRALALATADYGLGERSFGLLPAVHRNYDQAGQLRRFLEVLGAALDQLRSQAEGLRDRHDVLAARADLLPYLAHLIGWELDQTLDELAQRRDILFVPDLYGTVGTIPGLRALANHVTGWDSRVKEYVHNIFLSNAVEPIRLWEIWEMHAETRDETSGQPHWSDPVRFTTTDGFDGRPAVLFAPDKTVRLYWHADREGPFQLWEQAWIPADTASHLVLAGAAGGSTAVTGAYPAAAADTSGAWLFWEAGRSDQRDIWCRRPGGEPEPLTDHPADDCQPAAVCDAQGRVRLFWASNRRGPTDIWTCCPSDGDGAKPVRITTAYAWHGKPAAALDGDGRLWLFWCGAAPGTGGGSGLYAQTFATEADGGLHPLREAECLSLGTGGASPGARLREESPSAVWWNGMLWLFWHSDRGGHWQIWGRVREGDRWGEPCAVTHEMTADKEPAAFVDGDGVLHLFWCSQRGGRRCQSRTVDLCDGETWANLGTLRDRAHYTVDTGRRSHDLYGRGTVGLFLRPDTEDAELLASQSRRLADVLRAFLPIQVRLVVFVEPVADSKRVFPDAVPQTGPGVTKKGRRVRSRRRAARGLR